MSPTILVSTGVRSREPANTASGELDEARLEQIAAVVQQLAGA